MTTISNEHMNRFLHRVKGMKSEATYETRKNALRRFSEWLDKTDYQATEIGPLEIEDFLADLANEGYAPNSIDSSLSGVRLFYKFLDRKEIIDENPADDVDQSNVRSLTNGTKKHNEADVVYVSENEKETMVEHAPSPQLRNRLIIRLLWQTGVRGHELTGMELENIDREERSIRVYSSKTDDWRTVYYQPSLDFLLDQWIDSGYRDAYGPATTSPYLFPSQRSEQISRQTVGKLVVQAAKNAGCQEKMYEDASGKPKWRITTHSLRHGHAVHALRCGVDIRTLQKHLGHQNIDTTERYLRILDDDVREAYQKFGDSDSL
jgi:integrase/recombinase XerD